MKLTPVLAAFFIGSAAALPQAPTSTSASTAPTAAPPAAPPAAPGVTLPFAACRAGQYGGAQCCATDVLGVADLDCANPPTAPGSAADFTAVCAKIGQRARCCVLPILKQGVLCQTPPGAQG